MSHVSDCMTKYMLEQIQAVTPSFDYAQINDVIYQWLKTQLSISISVHSTIDDLWELFFDNKGVATGAFNDRYSAWLISLGYSGALQDMKYQLWCIDGGVLPGGEDALDYIDRPDLEYIDRPDLEYIDR